MKLINQYSFLFAILLSSIILGVVLWRLERVHIAVRLSIAFLFLFGVIFARVKLTYIQNFDGSAETVQTAINNNQPTFVMLYSNY